MILSRKIRCYKTIYNDTIDITDPCYSRGVWCRLNDIPIEPGEYRFAYYKGYKHEQCDIDRLNEIAMEFDEGPASDKDIEKDLKDIQSRVFCIEIQRKGRAYQLNSSKWEYIGSIGVDAGLAGFFWNKPDFDDDAWSDFCSKINWDKDTFIDQYGFYSSSGYGDGCYEVYGIKEGDKYIALKICF